MTRSYAEVVSTARAVTAEMVWVERQASYAVVRLSDPGKLNVLSAALMLQLEAATQELVADSEIRAIVLTGAGPAFSAGGDLRMMQKVVERLGSDQDTEGAFMPYQWIRQRFGAFVRLIARSDTPFVAALNGPAAGVGLAFAMACDITLAAEEAVLVPAFGRLGLVPEVGTSWALTRALGYRRAFAFYVAGEQLDARRAAELGLVDEVLRADRLLPRAEEWCQRICALPAHAIPLTKPLLRAASDASWEQSLFMVECVEPICFTTRGFAEGVKHVVAATASDKRPA
jgi:2-(1,2-epoxy-1,2-dihydrophenyl)acetyl-CoA isomerase